MMKTLSPAWLKVSGCSKPEDMGLAFSSETKADQVRLLVDETWVDAVGQRHVQQEIFESVFSMIDEAEKFILLDFFLMNEFLYDPVPGMRSLCA